MSIVYFRVVLVSVDMCVFDSKMLSVIALIELRSSPVDLRSPERGVRCVASVIF